jgi:hypothetical protein
MPENRSEGSLVRAEPQGLAERLCHRMIREERITGGALLLDAEPAWTGAINTVLVENGVRVGVQVSEPVRRSRCGSASQER